MNTTARSILIASAIIGLVAFTAFSAFTASAAMPLATGALAIVALSALMVKTYTPRRVVRSRVTLRSMAPAPGVHRMPTMVRVPAVVEYASRRTTVRAA